MTMHVGLFFPRFKYRSGDPPLGVGYLAAYLQKHSGARVSVIDTTFRTRRQVLDVLAKEKFDLAGISIMSTAAADGYWIAGNIKKRHPGTCVVFGGPHPTILPEAVLERDCADAVVTGEGEETLADLVNRSLSFEDVPGLVYKKDGRIVKAPPRPLPAGLDALGVPAYHLLDMEKYIRAWFQMDAVSPALRGTNIIATRGCPYACAFCQPTLDRLFGKKLRLRTPGHIVAELLMLKERYNIRSFIFADDTLNIDRAWLRSLCAEMVRAKTGLVWGCNIRANLADREELEIMKEAGLRKVFMGIESGSDRILRTVYHKGITVEQVRKAVALAHGLGLKIQGYFMLGAPGETKAEIKSTLRLARGLDLDDATFSITTPLPGTFLYDKTRHAVSRPVEDFDYYKTYVYDRSMGFTQGRLRFYRIWAFASFYLSYKRLGRLLRMVLSPDGIKKLLLKLRRL